MTYKELIQKLELASINLQLNTPQDVKEDISKLVLEAARAIDHLSCSGEFDVNSISYSGINWYDEYYYYFKEGKQL